jgi:hypothetical protein
MSEITEEQAVLNLLNALDCVASIVKKGVRIKNDKQRIAMRKQLRTSLLPTLSCVQLTLRNIAFALDKMNDDIGPIISFAETEE